MVRIIFAVNCFKLFLMDNFTHDEKEPLTISNLL